MKLRQIYQMIQSFVQRIGKDRVNMYAAAASFYVILSFVPFVMLLLLMVQYTPLTKADVLNAVTEIVPSSFASFFIGIINDIFKRSATLLSVTAVTAVWSASRALLSISYGLNSVYHVTETRNIIIMRLRSVFYTVLFLFAVVLTLLMLVFGNSINQVISSFIPEFLDFSAVVVLIRTVVTLLFLVVLFVFVYRFLPNRKATLRSQLPGAMFLAVAWGIFSYGFSIYIDVFDGTSNMYGSLATVAFVMLWLYFCMLIILIGGEINAFFEDKIQDMILKKKHKKQLRKQERKSKRGK